MGVKCIIYGCDKASSEALKGMFSGGEAVYYVKEKSNLYIGGYFGQEIQDVNADEYDFVLIGNEDYKDDIYRKCRELGFCETQIVPVEWVHFHIHPWKRILFLRHWAKITSCDGIDVIKSWYCNEKTLSCIIRVRGHIYSKLHIKMLEDVPFSITVEDLIDGERESICDQFVLKDDYALLKISVHGLGWHIPWARFVFSETAERKEIKDNARYQAYCTQMASLKDFWYHDEDYLALENWKDEKGVVVDFGANYGQSINAFYRTFSEARIISFEAVPELYDLLNVHIAEHHMGDRVEVYNMGVADKSDTLVWCEPLNKNISGSFDEELMVRRGFAYEKRLLLCHTMNEILKNEKSIFFIKMDIEGMEYKALMGGLEIILREMPILLLEDGKNHKEITELLQEYYEEYYYDPDQNKFFKSRKTGINYWLIPRKDYRRVEISEDLFE